METEQDQLNLIKSLFLKMGASEEQAKMMASQLFKRAGQIASDRGVSIVEAVEILLKQVVEAQQGR
ncbi:MULTISPECIES: hypothetical protein [unclassified Lentimonas]|uniref:hypothetical protein n=1 Tax=unclassified Lentimonas TaxID=2630993 RepID=UPI0013269D0C|nr:MULTISPECIES: hypothetical protein [unclassified Lentimonas]CAA6680203.1 Unannotated [Lentimonas sp. CC4]CAA6687043.1 Unannotated [Lentimonas sp. CC6]CAA7076183.1 Unannotated [Lentimonas sp. CC4]CAA7171168.1 Unannotated [Lentimonas sp. CC21]CAA7182749.1 Unannotated [Lentimonas sp. CC8]